MMSDNLTRTAELLQYLATHIVNDCEGTLVELEEMKRQGGDSNLIKQIAKQARRVPT
jgi:hypothetical protein